MLTGIGSIICDMDGVLWRGPEKLPGMNALFDFMAGSNLDFALATNNSRNTPRDYIQKLSAMGVSGIEPRQIVTSGTATASYLRAHYAAGTTLYVIGGDGLKQTLVKAGFVLVERDAELVVCGVDFDLTYNRVKTATLLIRAGRSIHRHQSGYIFSISGGAGTRRRQHNGIDRKPPRIRSPSSSASRSAACLMPLWRRWAPAPSRP